jgi:hypothetical protein
VLVSLYCALGGHALISAAGGYVSSSPPQAMVRPAGAGYPRGWLLAGSAAASALLVVYGGLNVLPGALVLSGVIHPAGSADRTPLRWHVGVWDLWFLVWGILLALATAGY